MPLTRSAPTYQDAPTQTAQALGLPLAEPIEIKRRLAAIFASDVELYSLLMGADEVATLDALTARREGYANDPQFDRKEAVRLARLALSIDDSDPETLARASVISAFIVGDSEAEIEMADRAVALNPNSWITWNNRGHVYRIAGLPEEAIRSFECAIRMSPVDPRLYMTLTGIGQALIELRRFDEAIVVLKKALRQNLSYLATYRLLASAFAHLGRDAEARDAAARVLEIDPSFTISALIARVPKNSKLFIEGLRKAGLPE